MSSISGSDRSPAFGCEWSPNGVGAALAVVSGELDMATAARLEGTLREAFEHACLVVLDLRQLSFVGSTGLHVLLKAAQQGREAGGRLVLVEVPAAVTRLLELTGAQAMIDVLPNVPPGVAAVRAERPAPRGVPEVRNPVNARIVKARVMDVADRGLWLHGPDGTVRRAWAPTSAGSRLRAGIAIEVYLDHRDAVNGWWYRGTEPGSGVAVNQRHLAAGDEPATAPGLACQGECGLLWRAPAAARFDEHERCLTCAGPLALV